MGPVETVDCGGEKSRLMRFFATRVIAGLRGRFKDGREDDVFSKQLSGSSSKTIFESFLTDSDSDLLGEA